MPDPVQCIRLHTNDIAVTTMSLSPAQRQYSRVTGLRGHGSLLALRVGPFGERFYSAQMLSHCLLDKARLCLVLVRSVQRPML